jgi:hypothetical protein
MGSGWLSLAAPQQIPQLHSGLMQLRLAISDGTAHHGRNFIMLVTLNIMQHKNRAITRRQLF